MTSWIEGLFSIVEALSHRGSVVIALLSRIKYGESIDGQEYVFDNIHTQGISRVEWVKSFYSPIQDLGQDFKITETHF